MIISYLLKTVIIAGLLTGYYLLFLRNRGFHRFNRIFLLTVPAISFLLPLLRFEWSFFWPSEHQNEPIRLLQVVQGEMEETVTIYANRPFSSWFTWQNGLATLSIGISVFLLVRLLVNLNALRRLARRGVLEKIEGAELCFVEAKGTPFSFFRRIFWNPAIDLQTSEGRQILRHELYHVNALHSADILWLELVGILAWFNPFFYLIRKEVIMIHEFMADAEASTDPVAYAGLLLKHQSDRLDYPGITHSFFHHPLKRRIVMLTKISFQKNRITGRLLVLPLLLLLTGLFAFKTSWRHLAFAPAGKKIKLVVDPGHGGVNAGAHVNGIKEEEMNLTLAKKIREVAKSYDVEVVLTREGDNTPEPEQTLKSSLEYRAKFAGDQHADAFISIHMNSNDASEATKTSGFEIYVPNKKKGNPLYEQSIKLGSSVNAILAKDYKTYAELKERDHGIYILDNARVPAIMVECGSMDVREDMDFMSSPANQEKIARDIIEGVLKFSSASTSYALPAKTAHGPNNAAVDSPDETLDAGTEPALINPIAAPDSTPALKKVEVESEFPGGFGAWKTYLVNNLHYPSAAVANEIQGTVAVEFIVKSDGSISPADIHAISGPKELQAESIRVIRESGKWTPAKNNGVAVNAYKIQPISFKLEPPGKK